MDRFQIGTIVELGVDVYVEYLDREYLIPKGSRGRIIAPPSNARYLGSLLRVDMDDHGCQYLDRCLLIIP